MASSATLEATVKKTGQPQTFKSTYDQTNWLSRVFCLYIFPFLYRNYAKDLDLTSIDACNQADLCTHLADRLRQKWTQEVQKGVPSLLRAILRTYGLTYLLQNVKNFLVFGCLRMALPLLLGRIIYYSNLYFEQKSNLHPKGDSWNGLTAHQSVILNSVLLSLIIFANFCLSHPYFFSKSRYGMNIRVAVTRLIYEKSLKVTTSAVQRITSGKIVNLLSNDASRFDAAYQFVDYVYLAPLETAVGLTLLYQYIGRSCFGALLLLLLYIPFQTAMANLLSRLRSASAGLTDDRLRLMAELLPAMRVIKMYVWERPFARLVHRARRLEIVKIRHSMILRSLNLALYFVAPKVLSFTCLILFLLDGGQLNAEIVFVTLSLVAHIRDVITLLFPLGISNSVEAYISVKRIEAFLLEEEIEPQVALPEVPEIPEIVDISPASEPKIVLDRVNVNSPLDGSPILRNISFTVVPRQLTVIIGPVGSGKSSILLSLLKELSISGAGSAGSLQVNGRIAYSSQEAWIFAGSVRENILFGRPWDGERYQTVVKMAALKADFLQLEDGDQTAVEERGTSLSGGQRGRISLARALYSPDADVYLLDAPLAAVDASVAKYIFERCIKRYLADKVVLLVTHQLGFVKQADQIVVLKDGACLASGTYLELLSRGIDLYKYSTGGTPEEREPMTPEVRNYRADSPLSEVFSHRSTSLVESEPDTSSILGDEGSILEYLGAKCRRHSTGGPDESTRDPDNMETSSAGSGGKLQAYWTYINSGASLPLFLVFLLVNLITQGLFTGTDVWLGAWTAYKELLQTANGSTVEAHPIIAHEESSNLITYSALVLGLFLFSIIRTVSYFVICSRASVRLHNRIFTSLIEAPLIFFDRTPIDSGTGLNIFLLCTRQRVVCGGQSLA